MDGGSGDIAGIEVGTGANPARSVGTSNVARGATGAGSTGGDGGFSSDVSQSLSTFPRVLKPCRRQATSP